jgi:iron uptake system EfeUOB component EfeO/EfeM
MGMKTNPRPRTTLVAVGAALVITVAFALIGGLGTGDHSASTTARATTPAIVSTGPDRVPLARYFESAPHVGSLLMIYGSRGGVGVAPIAPPPDAPPVASSAFAQPVAEYLAYSQAQLKLMRAPIDALAAALAANDRGAAQSAWEAAYARYLHLGAVYLEGPVADLDQRIDGNPGGLSGGTASPRFTGLHRIEYGLWSGAAPSSLLPYARQLKTDVGALGVELRHVTIDPLDYATRAHEILEDAQRDLLSGTDVPWSQQGVLGTAAGLAATQEVVATLHPLLSPNLVTVLNSDLGQLSGVFDALRMAHGGALPTNAELSQTESERLDAALGQALEGLSQVPGALETATPPTIPPIPAKDLEIDK